MARILSQDTNTYGTTYYVEILLSPRCQPVTALFVPGQYRPATTADVVLYFHGHRRRLHSVREYLNDSRWSSLLPALAGSGKNAVFVAPELGDLDEGGTDLASPQRFECYIQEVLATIGQVANGSRRVTSLPAPAPSGVGPGAARPSHPPGLRTLILAAHSGGGAPMLNLVRSNSPSLASLRECWAFDCMYNSDTGTRWINWLQQHATTRLFAAYIPYGQAPRSTRRYGEQIRNARLPNAIVEVDISNNHDLVPVHYFGPLVSRSPHLELP